MTPEHGRRVGAIPRAMRLSPRLRAMKEGRARELRAEADELRRQADAKLAQAVAIERSWNIPSPE